MDWRIEWPPNGRLCSTARQLLLLLLSLFYLSMCHHHGMRINTPLNTAVEDGGDDDDGDDDAVDTVSLSREHTTSTKQQPAVWRK